LGHERHYTAKQWCTRSWEPILVCKHALNVSDPTSHELHLW
jgi:hypothetical protein